MTKKDELILYLFVTIYMNCRYSMRSRDHNKHNYIFDEETFTFI